GIFTVHEFVDGPVYKRVKGILVFRKSEELFHLWISIANALVALYLNRRPCSQAIHDLNAVNDALKSQTTVLLFGDEALCSGLSFPVPVRLERGFVPRVSA